MRGKRVCAWLLIISLLSSLFPSSIFAQENLEVSVRESPLIDIALAVGDTETDLSEFKNDLLNELDRIGVNEKKVNITTFKTNTLDSNSTDASIIFNDWGRAGNTGQWSIVSVDGINTIQNAENTSGITSFYYPENFDATDIIIEYDNRSTNSDDDYMGCMVRFNVDENSGTQMTKKVTTYLIVTNKKASGFPSSMAGLNKCGIWKIENNPINNGDTSNNMTQLVSAPELEWSRNTWSKYRIEVTGANIKVWKNDILCVDYTDPNPIKSGSYGVFSWSQPYAQFRNVSVLSQTTKSFLDILLETTWREDSLRFVVNVEDKLNEGFITEPSATDILSRTVNENVHFIEWGQAVENRTEMEGFIAKNNNNGLYIDNTDYQKSIEKTAEYIKNYIDNLDNNLEYILENTEFEIDVNPISLKTNTADSIYPDGKWKMVHSNKDFYENSNGLWSGNMGYREDLDITSLNKVGEYTLTFEDEVVQILKVHRKPIAEFTIDRNNLSLNLINLSYDLDLYSEDNGFGPGLQNIKWSYMKEGDDNWTEEKLETLEEDSTYIIKLEVQDLQGVWSEPVSKYISTKITPIEPVGMFSFLKNQYSIYETITDANNFSYDPAGLDITEYKWLVKKDDVKISEYTFSSFQVPDADFETNGVGQYTYSLTIKNSAGLSSNTYTQSVNVVLDNEKPEISVNPIKTDYTEGKNQITVDLGVSDTGSGLDFVKYAVTNSQTPPSAFDNEKNFTTENSFSDQVIISQPGESYLHIKTSDKANNEESNVFGPYQIDVIAPIINSVNATELDLMPFNLNPALITNKSVLLDFNITEEHSGFNYLEYKIDSGNWLTGEIDEKYIVIDTPVLESMKIRAYDKAGNVSDIFQINNLVIENTAPVITVSQVPEWSNTDIDITIDGQDNNGVSSIMWQTSESEPQTGTILPDELPATITLSNEGIYSFNATIYDKSGNSTRSETRTIRIDKVSPTVGDIVIHAPQNKIVIEEQKAEANLLFAGATIFARTNFASTATDFETWYGRKPIIEIVASDISGNTNSGVAYITYRMVSDDGSIETSWQKITADSKGRFFFILDNDFEGIIYVKAYDKADNVSAMYSEWMSIKTPASTGTGSGNNTGNTEKETNYAPSLYLSVPNNDVWVNSAKATIIANDNSGLASVKMKVETTNSSVNDYEKELLMNMGDTSLNKEELFTQSGIYDITVTAKDTDGKETVVTGTIKIDNDLPIINGVGTELVGPDGNPVSPDDDVEGKRVKVTVDVTDDLSGLDYLEYKTADSDEWVPVAKGQTSFYVSTSYNGEIEIRGYDKAGNSSPKCTSDPISITSSATVEISRPSGWGGTDGKTINIKSTRWDEIEKIVYSYIPADGIEKAVTITSDGTTANYNKDELFTAPGTYEVIFNIYKKDGNMNIVSREIKIDSVTTFKAPSINSFGYEFGSVSNENVVLDLFYHPEDMPASGIARYEYKDPVSGQWEEGIPTFTGDTDEEYIFRAVSNSGLVSETTEPVKIKISSITNYFPTLELVNGNIGSDYLIELKASDWVEETDSGYLYIWEDGKVGGNYTPAMKVLSSDERVSILGDAIYIDGEEILKPGTTYWITTDVGFVQDGFYNPSKALNKVCFKTEKAPSIEINGGAGNDILISTGKPSGGKTEYDIFLEPGFSGELELVIPNGDTIKNTGSEGGLIINGNGNSFGVTIPEDADLENGKIIIETENGDELIFNIIPSEINVNLNIDPSTGVSDIDKNTVIDSIDLIKYLQPGYSADVTLNIKHGSGNRYSEDIEKAETLVNNSLKYNDLSKPIVIETLVNIYDENGNIIDEIIINDFKTPLEVEIEVNGMHDFNHSDFGAIFSPSNSTSGSFINDIIKSYDKMTIGLTSPGEIFVTSKEDYQDIEEEEDYDRDNKYDDDDDDRDYNNKKETISWEEKLGLDKTETEENKPQIDSAINLPPLTNTNKEYYKPDLNWYNHIPESMKGVSDINILRDTYCVVPISVNNPDMIAPYSYVNTDDMFEFVKPTNETYTLVKNHHDFNDMTYNWAYAAVHAMASREIVVGYPDGGFHPNNNITRGEFATMLARLEKLPLGTYTSSYGDVSVNDWYHPYIEAVTAAGYMNGYNNGNFGPKDPITREQMAATLYRYLQYRGWMPDTTDMGKITDKYAASAYAVDGINALYNLGIITGYPDNSFKPRNNATRAETCNMIWKLILNEVNNRYDTFQLDIFDVDQNTTGPKHEFFL